MSEIDDRRAQLSDAIANVRRQIEAAQDMAAHIRMKEGFRTLDDPSAIDSLYTLLGQLEDALASLDRPA